MSDHNPDDDRLLILIAKQADDAEGDLAPPRLKSRLYTLLVRRQEESGSLLSLAETRTQGHGLCVFEDLWQRATSGEVTQRFNCCSLCHARVLAEHLERAPIFWDNCPYVAFGKK